MKKNILASIACATLLWAATTGCSEETVLAAGDDAGYIALNLDFDPSPLTGPRGDRSRANAAEITKDDLTLTLTHASGAISPKTFTVPEFGAQQRVNTGQYTLEANYGTADSEGWDAPYYYGSQQLTVKNETSTPVNLPVSLANAIINVTLSDGFTDYMADYTVTVTTVSGTDYVWAKDETRKLYVKPGSVMVSVAFTKPNGKTATAQVDPFTAEARHQYNISIDIEAGTAEMLNLTIDDTIADVKDVDIDISDANLPMLAAAPEILTDGFESGATVTNVAGCTYDGTLKATIVARGTIESAVLNITSAYLKSKGMPESIDLANPGASQSLLDTYGIKTLGLTGTKAVFAVVDFSSLISKLLYVDGADNTSSFSLTVTDAQGKDKTLDLFSASIEKLTLEILDGSEITAEGQATVKIHYNGGTAQDNIKLYAHNNRGTVDELTFTATSGSQTDTYDLAISSSLITLDQSLTIYATAGEEKSDDYLLKVPSLRLIEEETNAFAKHAYVTVRLTNEEAIAAKGNVKFEVSTDGNTYKEVTSTVDGSRSRALAGGTVTYHLTGLTDGTNYTFRAKLNDETTGTATFTTEEATQLPNAGMEEWYSEQRGDYQTWWFPAATKDASWCTMNAKTTSTYGSGSSVLSYGGTAYRATSGTIPANANIDKSPSATANSGNQHSGDNAALIRTVGWGKNNTSFGYSGKCENITSGELFLGSIDTSFSAIRGMSFSSRPAAISFYYKYIPFSQDNGDYGVVEIIIKDADGNEISKATKNLDSKSSYELETIPLTYASTSAKPKFIEVNFFSTGNSNCLTFNEKYISDAGSANWTNNEYVGSKLYIDDIELIY